MQNLFTIYNLGGIYVKSTQTLWVGCYSAMYHQGIGIHVILEIIVATHRRYFSTQYSRCEDQFFSFPVKLFFHRIVFRKLRGFTGFICRGHFLWCIEHSLVSDQLIGCGVL